MRGVVKGKRVVVIDDSIVRGTTSKRIVQMLKEAGAAEVHMRISSPPLKYPCFYGIDISTTKELIAAKKSVDEIRDYIGADSWRSCRSTAWWNPSALAQPPLLGPFGYPPPPPPSRRPWPPPRPLS